MDNNAGPNPEKEALEGAVHIPTNPGVPQAGVAYMPPPAYAVTNQPGAGVQGYGSPTDGIQPATGNPPPPPGKRRK